MIIQIFIESSPHGEAYFKKISTLARVFSRPLLTVLMTWQDFARRSVVEVYLLIRRDCKCIIIYKSHVFNSHFVYTRRRDLSCQLMIFMNIFFATE